MVLSYKQGSDQVQNIYLIRHGEPDFPDGKVMCLGTTDLPLSRLGYVEAYLAGEALQAVPLKALYCSRLKRSRQTAMAIRGGVREKQGFEELCFGEFDGMTFEKIRADYPELYETYGRDRSVLIPGAEGFEAAFERFDAALRSAASEAEGDFAVVAHNSVMAIFLAAITGQRSFDMLPYCSATRLLFDGTSFSLLSAGEPLRPSLDGRICDGIIRAAENSRETVAHCHAVCDTAMGIALSCGGMDIRLLGSAALLHGIAADEAQPYERGALYLRKLGYNKEAELVEGLGSAELDGIDESAALYLANALIAGTEKIGVSELKDAKAATIAAAIGLK